MNHMSAIGAAIPLPDTVTKKNKTTNPTKNCIQVFKAPCLICKTERQLNSGHLV